jgi:hypothetical protein
MGYLEWAKDQHFFVYALEYDLFLKFTRHPNEVLHPLIIIPFIGQVFLIIALLQNKPNKNLIFLGIGCLSLLYLMLFIVGIAAANLKIILSSLPFLILSALIIKMNRNKRTKHQT